jgi:hypothetical protein
VTFEMPPVTGPVTDLTPLDGATALFLAVVTVVLRAVVAVDAAAVVVVAAPAKEVSVVANVVEDVLASLVEDVGPALVVFFALPPHAAAVSPTATTKTAARDKRRRLSDGEDPPSIWLPPDILSPDATPPGTKPFGRERSGPVRARVEPVTAAKPLTVSGHLIQTEHSTQYRCPAVTDLASPDEVPPSAGQEQGSLFGQVVLFSVPIRRFGREGDRIVTRYLQPTITHRDELSAHRANVAHEQHQTRIPGALASQGGSLTVITCPGPAARAAQEL